MRKLYIFIAVITLGASVHLWAGEDLGTNKNPRPGGKVSQSSGNLGYETSGAAAHGKGKVSKSNLGYETSGAAAHGKGTKSALGYETSGAAAKGKGKGSGSSGGKGDKGPKVRIGSNGSSGIWNGHSGGKGSGSSSGKGTGNPGTGIKAGIPTSKNAGFFDIHPASGRGNKPPNATGAAAK